MKRNAGPADHAAITFFISYRRADTGPVALLLKYEIEKRLQFVRAAVDVEDMRPSQVFPDRIRQLIDGANATIVLIGNEWMPHTGDDPSIWPEDRDWVAAEIAYSLNSPGPNVGDVSEPCKRAIIPFFVGPSPDFRKFRIPAEVEPLTYCHAEHITHANWPSQIGPLLDRIATNYGLKKRPDAEEYPNPNRTKARTQPMSDTELSRILAFDDYDGWYIDNFGNADATYVAKTFKFRGFNQASDFMHAVSNYCTILDHHPEWRNVFNHVSVALTTWDARRRVTIYDLNLALYMNRVAARIAGGKPI